MPAVLFDCQSETRNWQGVDSFGSIMPVLKIVFCAVAFQLLSKFLAIRHLFKFN
jgi:hypothetical protein